MAEPKHRRKDTKGIARMQAGRRFGGYQKESLKRAGEADIRESEAVKVMAKIFLSKYMERVRWEDGEQPPRLDLLDYTAEDVKRLTGLMPALLHGSEGSGVGDRFALSTFLSDVCSMGKGGRYEISVPEGIRPRELLARNTKDIVVIGDGGSKLGSFQQGGAIRVKGSTSDEAGYAMEGGSIIIEGDGGIAVGSSMKGGIIEVFGDAGEGIGTGMSGGKIIIHGDARGTVGEYIHRPKYGSISELAMRTGGPIHAGSYISLDQPWSIMTGGEIHIEGTMFHRIRMEGGKVFHKGKLIEER